MLGKIFGKIICSTHQKKHFYNIWGSFWKIEFLTENRQAQTLQNSENLVLSQNGVRNYFLAKLFVPLIKRNLSTIFEAVFGKLNFWRKIDRRGPYKIVKFFWLSQNGVRKYFWQNYLFHSSKETFLQHLRQFLENWIFDWKSTGVDLTNCENLVLSQNGVRKYFLAKLFVPLIKRNISTSFGGVYGKLNFWRKMDRRGPNKIVKIWYYLKMG